MRIAWQTVELGADLMFGPLLDNVIPLSGRLAWSRTNLRNIEVSARLVGAPCSAALQCVTEFVVLWRPAANRSAEEVLCPGYSVTSQGDSHSCEVTHLQPQHIIFIGRMGPRLHTQSCN